MTSINPLATKTRRRLPRFRKADSFSLVEVVVATGICTYALLVIASLLPVGMTAIQTANQQVVQTEIFNQMWSEMDTTPYGSLTNYPGFTNNLTATTYFDRYGQSTTNLSSAVYTVVCTQPALTNTALTVSGSFVPTSTTELNAVRVSIGFHVNPTNTSISATDPRVTTRTFYYSRRDGSSNVIPNNWSTGP